MSEFNIKIKKNLPAPKIKETKKTITRDYYKPIKTKSSFNGNFEHESKEVKDKHFRLENILILSDHFKQYDK